MRKLLSLIICLTLFLAVTISVDVLATDITIRNDTSGIPCRVVYQSILRAINNGRNTFTRAEASKVTTLAIERMVRPEDGGFARGINDFASSLRGVGYLTNLRRLDLNVVRFSGTDLKQLENLPALRDLRITGSAYVTASVRSRRFSEIRNLRGLRNLVNLRRLEFNFGNLRNLSGIEGLVNLRDVRFRDNQITNLSGVENLKNLRILILDINRLTNLRGIANLRNLQTLNASSNRLTNLNEVRRLTNLKHLRVQYNRLNCINTVRNLRSLRILAVWNNRLTRLPNMTEHSQLSVNGSGFQSNRLPESQLRTRLPARLRRHNNGRWLRNQLASQNS